MPIQRKRKASSVGDHQQQPSTFRINTTTQQTIHVFGSVAKPIQNSNDGKKRKMGHQRQATPPPAPTVKLSSKAERKRKRDIIAEESDEEIAIPLHTMSTTGNHQPVDSTPRNKRYKNAMPPTPEQTPSKRAAALFDQLRLDANVTTMTPSLSMQELSYDTPPKTPSAESDIDLTFPSELADLRDMYGSFLAALSLHYSHNGTSTPVELHALLPMIAKHWKKRRVSQKDLQQILGLTPEQERAFVLEDFGRAGLRLSRAELRGRALKRAANYIDEEDLNRCFEAALQKRWHTWQAGVAKENRTAAAFMDQLPLLGIIKNEAADKASSLFARGEQRLAELKASQAAKAATVTTEKESPFQRSTKSVQSRSTALFDRILAKQTFASSLPTGPTKLELERKSALQKIEEVVRVLSLMCGRKDRCTFSMQVVIQQLQQSLRNPITGVEVWRCLGLMSTEILPGFVKIVHSGEVQGVIVTRSGNVGPNELKAMIDKACA